MTTCCRITFIPLAIGLLTACGGLSTSKMTPERLDPVEHTIGTILAIGSVTGGRKPTFGGPEMIDDDRFAGVLLNAAQNSGVFGSASAEVDSATDLILNAKITAQSQEVFGALGYHGLLTVEYEFVDASNKQPIWTLSIPSSQRVTFAQAFSGAARTIKAREGSVRNNLAAFTRALNPWKAAAGGSVAMLRRFQATGSGLGDKDVNGHTPLMIAAYHGQLAAVNYLLQEKVTLDAQNEQGSTALLAALSGGRAAVASELLERGASPQPATKQGETALMLAAGIPSASLVERLIKAGIDPNRQSQTGLNAVVYAAMRDDVELMNLLFDNGAKPVQARGDVDVAVAVGKAFEAFASWRQGPEAADQFARAVQSYQQALTQLEEAERDLNQRMLDDRKRQQAAMASAEFHQSLMDLGLQLQARANARQFRQVQALGVASRTGTGTQGYFSALRSLERSPDFASMQYPDVAFSRTRYELLVEDDDLRVELVRNRKLQTEITQRLKDCEQRAQ